MLRRVKRSRISVDPLEKDEDLPDVIGVRAAAGQLLLNDVEHEFNPLVIMNVRIYARGSLPVLRQGKRKVTVAVVSLEASGRVHAAPACGELMQSSGNRVENLPESSAQAPEIRFLPGQGYV